MEEYSDSDSDFDSKSDRNVNIIFTIGGPTDYDDEYDSDYSGSSDSDYSYDGSDIESDDGSPIETRSSKRSKKKAMYICENECGYEGNYSDCEKHEETCKRKHSNKKKSLASRSKGKIEQDSSSDGSDEDASDKMTDEEAIQKFTRMIDGLSEKIKRINLFNKCWMILNNVKPNILKKRKRVNVNKNKPKQKNSESFFARKIL